MTLLKVEDLRVEFATVNGSVKALDGVSFTVDKGEVIGIVGESGSGKTTLGLAILKILPPNGRIVSGKIVTDPIKVRFYDAEYTEGKIRREDIDEIKR